MRRSIFVDTSGWIALADEKDENHGRARELFRSIFTEYQQVTTTNHVVGETYTTVRCRMGFQTAWQFLRNVQESRRLKTVFVSREQEQDAFDLLGRYSDQRLSFVDATSFVVMKDNGIFDCFAFDRHFLSGGFQIHP